MNEFSPAPRRVEYHEIAVIAAAGNTFLDNLLDIGLVEPILLMEGISRFPARGEQLLGKLNTRPCGGGGGRNAGGRNARGNRMIAVWVHICLLGYQLLKSVSAGLKQKKAMV
jgi:hypothetical protein